MTTAACVAATAQAPSGGAKEPAFDVTSVKQNRSGDVGMGGPGDRFQTGQLRLTNRPLRILIGEAFGRRLDIIGGPVWIDTDRWDVAGKTDSAAKDVMPRLRTLPADRFKLVTHHETRELPIYALVIARRDGRLGPSLRPSTESSGFRITAGFFKGRAPLGVLIDALLSSATQRPVVDRTGLTGVYDIELHWTPEASAAGPGDVLVIDHVERPMED